MNTTKTKTQSKTAYELKLAVGYKTAVMVTMAAGLLAFTIFSIVWKIKS